MPNLLSTYTICARSDNNNLDRVFYCRLVMAAKKKRRKSCSAAHLNKKATSNRPAKLRCWSNESMLQAMEAVRTGKTGVNRAALEHGVPPTTLKDRLSGRVLHGTSIGPKSYLTKDEEQELVTFLINCSKMGYGKTRSEVLKIVEATMMNNDLPTLYGSAQLPSDVFESPTASAELPTHPQPVAKSPLVYSSEKSLQASSPIAEFLKYPTAVAKTKVKPMNKSARILTSIESRLLLEEKQQKKNAEEEEKAKRKVAREEKRLAKEKEKEAKNEKKRQKLLQNEAKKANEYSLSKSSKRPSSLKSYPKRKKKHLAEESCYEDTCFVCAGIYLNDIDEETGVVLAGCDWIQCSSEECGVVSSA